MSQQFWLDKWKNQDIGFNQQQINPHLLAFHPQLGALAGKKVYVPLCGKSIDMAWLLAQGAHVIGVELSQLALEQFFDEQGLQQQVSQEEDFLVFAADHLTLYCGDFFVLTHQLADIDVIYDRAALIALPPELRQRYAEHLTQLAPANTHMLLITLAYAGEQPGPPFSVTDDEVQQLYQQHFHIERLYHQSEMTLPPHLSTRGFLSPSESVFLLTKKNRG